ncbi:MAG: NIPSNAP family protein [Actinomycetota bacterium]
MLTQTLNNSDCAVFELRQYTLHPGRRDDLIEVFEGALIESQEAVGMRIVGTFRDLGAPDRFVWIRGFADVADRADGLAAFYGGPVWAANRQAANATMVDSDDVLLLRNTDPAHPIADALSERPPIGAVARKGLVLLTVYHLEDGADVLVNWLSTDVHHFIEGVLRVSISTLRTDPSPNTFPALPVRADVNAFAWAAAFDDEDHCAAALARLESEPTWMNLIRPRLNQGLRGQQVLRLQPTARSSFPERPAPA